MRHSNTALKQQIAVILHVKEPAVSSSAQDMTNVARQCVSVTNVPFLLKWTNSMLHVRLHLVLKWKQWCCIQYSISLNCTVNPGPNTIRRRSDESSVTIPYERSFRRIGSNFQPTGQAELSQFQFCGCGWPQHMLVPRGTPEGARYDVFVMISNMADDRVNQTPNLWVFFGNEHNIQSETMHD